MDSAVVCMTYTRFLYLWETGNDLRATSNNKFRTGAGANIRMLRSPSSAALTPLSGQAQTEMSKQLAVEYLFGVTAQRTTTSSRYLAPTMVATDY